MLDVTKIGAIAATYSPQELIAAMVWQRRFNEFDGPEVITDLSLHPDLWCSFLFTKPIYAPDENGLSFCGVVDTLLAMANYCPMPETSIIHFIPYPADTLYILAENRDTIVAQLVELGKKWRADSVDIDNGTNEAEEWEFQHYIQTRLKRALWGKRVGDLASDRDAVIVTYWWD